MSDHPENLGTHRIPPLRPAKFPDLDHLRPPEGRPPGAVDVLLVNPPAPDGGIWIRSQHRVGRRSRENMVWPQVDLAQMAALLSPRYAVDVIDAVAERMTWDAFEEILREKRPKYYLTQITAPTLRNDMYGAFLAKEFGAVTMGFGTHVTPLPRETLRAYPALDFVLRGEPELILLDLVDLHEGRFEDRPPEIAKLFDDHDAHYVPPNALAAIKGLAYRTPGGEIAVNDDRPFIRDLDDLPIPLHHLLPWEKYRVPLVDGPFTFIVPSRGCPAGCTFCIKHASYQHTVRTRSPENVLAELKVLYEMGIRNVHMYADLFTVSREQVMGICEGIIEAGLNIKWMCNSRVNYVDEEMLAMMARAGNWLIAWGLESGSAQILKNVSKGTRLEQAERALKWAKEAGIMNWGYFIIGLPGETEATIRETIDFAKALPLDIALFHIAAPYPGTPFFYQVLENGWFRPGTRWEDVDMDESTVLDYPGLPAERIVYWQKRAFWEWALRPGPFITYLKMLLSDPSTIKSAISVGLQHLGIGK